jgi:hypothetical protein
MDLRQHLGRQAAFSRATFGPGARTRGVSDHIRKELIEIQDAPTTALRSKEWVDVVILALDGLLRSCRDQVSGHSTFTANNSEIADMACRLIREKQEQNEMRDWPDWRTADPEKAIEHIK